MKSHAGTPCSILIKRQVVKNPGKFKSHERYEISYTKDFNSNSFHLISYRQQVEKDHLGPYLVSLCKLFYEQQEQVRSAGETVRPSVSKNTGWVAVKEMVFQCIQCLNVYDEDAGEATGGIAPNTRFEELPPTYWRPL
jgi:rubredoxin